MTAGHHSRLFGALLLGALTSIAVAFASGCIFAVVLTRDPYTGSMRWPASGGDIGAVLNIGGLFAMFATPIAAIVGFAVALPLFRYWAPPGRVSLWRLLAAALVLSAAAVIVTWSLMHSLADPSLSFATVTAAIAAPISALVVWLAARRTDPPQSSNNRWRGS